MAVHLKTDSGRFAASDLTAREAVSNRDDYVIPTQMNYEIGLYIKHLARTTSSTGRVWQTTQMSDQGSESNAQGERGVGGIPFKLIGLLLVVVAIAVGFFQNSVDAPVEFLWMDSTKPVWVVIGISVIAGILLDRLFTWQWRRARNRKVANNKS